MLIGLHGRKQAGKDTVCSRIAHVMAGVLEVERVAFADRLYASAAAALGVKVEQLNAWKTDPDVAIQVRDYGGDPYDPDLHANITVREYLQRYGTEAHREVFGFDFWVEQVPLEHDRRIVVVTDVRFENEARAVRRAGGYVVQVVGPLWVEAAEDAHASEKPLTLDLIDDAIANPVRDDGFRSLDNETAQLLRRLMKRAERAA